MPNQAQPIVIKNKFIERQPWYTWVQGADGQRLKKFNYNAAQLDIMHSTAMVTAMVAGTGSGKTRVGGAWLLEQIKKDPKGEYLVVAPTYKIMNRASLRAWMEAVEGTRFEGKGTGRGKAGWKTVDKEYRLPQGGVVYFASADKANSFQGCHVRAAWLDEGGMVPEEVFQVVFQRTAESDAPIFIGTTPYSNHVWLEDLIINPFKAGDPNFYVRNCNSLENPNYSRKRYALAKKMLSKHVFDMMYRGIFAGAQGQVFPEFRDCLTSELPPPRGIWYGAIDWGYTDPFVCLLGLLDDAGCLWVTWERYQTQMDILEHARALTQVNEAIKRKYGGYGVEQFAADASQPGSIELLKDHGLDVIKAPNSAGSIETGIELVRATMRSGKLKIYQPTEGEGTCPGLIKELRMYAYAVENDKPYGNKPVDKHSHAPDALRYLVWLVNRYADFLSLAA